MARPLYDIADAQLTLLAQQFADAALMAATEPLGPPTDPLGPAQDALIDALREEYEPVIASIVIDTTHAAGEQLAEERGSALNFSFDVINPYAVQYAAERSASLVTNIDAQTQAALREILGRGFREGRTVQMMAKEIRQIVGLNERQALALDNYRRAQLRWLTEQHPRTAPERIAERVEERSSRYAGRLLRERATMIARTETITAAATGQLAAWRIAQQHGYLRADARRFWVLAAGACPRCVEVAAMNPNGVPLDQPFASPEGGVWGPTLHPRCRCSTLVRDGASRAAATTARLAA